MPEWLVGFLIGGSGGGALGYFLRAKVDDHFATRAEGRRFRQGDLKELRDALLVFLGELRAHFSWLLNTLDPLNTPAEPSPDAKANLIGEWVYKNAPRFPKERRGSLYLITNVAYQLARGDRHYLETHRGSHEALEEAWRDLEEYAADLTRRLHGDA